MLPSYSSPVTLGHKSLQDLWGGTVYVQEKVDGSSWWGTPILLADGSTREIGKIVDNKEYIEVLSWNEQTQEIEIAPITNFIKLPCEKEDWYTMTVSRYANRGRVSKLIFTEYHRFLTQKGWVAIKDIIPGDEVFTPSIGISYEIEQFLLGSLLGDGYFTTTMPPRFTVSHTSKNSGLIDLAKKLLNKYGVRLSNTISGFGSAVSRLDTKISHEFSSISNIVHVAGKKLVTKEWMDQLGPIALAVWYMDDGSLQLGSNNQRPYALLHTNAYNDTECAVMVEMFRVRYGLEASIRKSRDYNYLAFDTESSQRLFSIISPYILSGYKYKLPDKYYNVPCFWDGYDFEQDSNTIRSLKVISVERGHASQRSHLNFKYDIEVAGNDNFFAKGVLTHNSQISFGVTPPDGCLHFRTPILLADGTSEMIGRLYNAGKPVDVLSYDINSNEMVVVRVAKFAKQWCDRKDWITVYVTPDGKKKRFMVVCTKDHLFRTSIGWSPATSTDATYIYYNNDIRLGHITTKNSVNSGLDGQLDAKYDIEVPGTNCFFANGVLVHNSQISFGIDNTGELSARSRGAQINLLDAGMFDKGAEAINKLRSILTPGYTYRGEYLRTRRHNVIAYSREPISNIILFDIDKGEQDYMLPEDLVAEAARIGLECVPLLATYTHMPALSTLEKLLEKDSILGNSKVEGIVLKRYDLFGTDHKVIMGKLVREDFKETHRQVWGDQNPSQKEFITKVIEKYGTPMRWQKAVQHLTEMGVISGIPQDIPFIMKEIGEDVFRECKDIIAEELFLHFWNTQIKRGLTHGMPDWYKEQLRREQFGEVDV
jgi:hypothetical protein